MTDVAALCAGIGGLERAVDAIWHDTRLVWTAEQDRHARTILTRHWPDAQHHGRFDEAGIDGGSAWHELEPPDILTAGFPCQDISYAGLGAGIRDRSGQGIYYQVPDIGGFGSVEAMLRRIEAGG